jgi:phage shock protein C
MTKSNSRNKKAQNISAPVNSTAYPNSAQGASQNYHYEPRKKLYKSTSDKWLGGVCGGLAKHFNMDPVLIRILWVVITIFSVGIGVVGYIVLWFFLDKEPDNYYVAQTTVNYDDSGRQHIHYHYNKAR